MILLSGERLARRLLVQLKRAAKKNLSLAVVQVGEDKASSKYIAEKEKVARELGIGFRFIQFPKNISEKKLTQEVERLSKDSAVSGIIVQLPLPKHMRAQAVLDAIPQNKDVDVLSSLSFAEFVLGTLPILPPTVAAISFLLKEAFRKNSGQAKKKLEEMRVAVVGAGRLVGLPVSLWLAQQGATVSLVQKGTKGIRRLISQADIVVSGVGKPGLITGSMIRKGAIVIDAGTSVEEGSTKGDVDVASVAKKASFLSPVPGGVGPLTVACLFQNLVELTESNKRAM